MRKKIDHKHLIEDVAHFSRETGLSPTLTAQEALNELCHYFLGDDWFEPTGQTHPEVVNFSIVEEIETRYKGVKIKKRKP